MKNTFIITKEDIREYQYTFIKNNRSNIIYYFFPILIFLIGIAIIVLGFAFSENKLFLYDAIFILIIILEIILYFVKINRIINLEYKRLLQLNNGNECYANYTFNEDEIVLFYESINGTRKLPYNQIVKMVESKNFYVIILQNKLILPVKKNGFIDSTEEDFVNFIKTKGKVKLKNKSESGGLNEF